MASEVDHGVYISTVFWVLIVTTIKKIYRRMLLFIGSAYQPLIGIDSLVRCPGKKAISTVRASFCRFMCIYWVKQGKASQLFEYLRIISSLHKPFTELDRLAFAGSCPATLVSFQVSVFGHAGLPAVTVLSLCILLWSWFFSFTCVLPLWKLLLWMGSVVL